MSYAITQTNGQLIMTLLDGTADGPDVNPGLNATDINLIGKNYPGYGQIQNEIQSLQIGGSGSFKVSFDGIISYGTLTEASSIQSFLDLINNQIARYMIFYKYFVK